MDGIKLRTRGAADWSAVQAAMAAGASMAEVAEQLGVTEMALRSRLLASERRVQRRAQAAGERAPPEGLSDLASDLLADLEEEDDPVAAADRLFGHGRRLVAVGRDIEAGRCFRQAREILKYAKARRLLTEGPASGPRRLEFEPLPAPPTLHETQVPPAGEWRTWLFLGGRGAGKTLAGAAWLAGQARDVDRLAIVAPTLGDAREVMIEGPSGLRGLAAGFGPAGGRPVYEPTRRRLLWPNGAVGLVFSAEDPDSLRGPQFGAAWADEFCAWTRSEAVLAQLRLALRLGTDPRLVVTTTPRPTAALRALLAEPSAATRRAGTRSNAANLAPGFVEGLEALYGGSRLARQELDGEVLEAPEGALFRSEDLARARALGAAGAPERFDRLVVAVDPPAGTADGEGGAACGLVIAGLVKGADGTARSGVGWVLADRTAHGLSPAGWAARVAEAAAWAGRRGPVRVVAEANQGGEMVRAVLAEAKVGAPVKLVRATLGKAARAEPVALLYEQGRVAHAGGLEALEAQLTLLGAGGEQRGGASPDRADALVWALTTLMLEPWPEGPRVRVL